MHRPELVTKLYEAAVKKVPLSEEYHSHLFMAYARVGDYKKMQQAGMALYKNRPQESILLLVCHESGDAGHLSTR
ncbi:unnamed protein product [Lampetra planeri]